MGQLGRDIGFGCKGISRISSKPRRGPIHVRARNRAGLGFISALNHFVVAAEEPPDPAAVLAGREEAAHHWGTWLCNHHGTAGL